MVLPDSAWLISETLCSNILKEGAPLITGTNN